jgi:hypothetical protein
VERSTLWVAASGRRSGRIGRRHTTLAERGWQSAAPGKHRQFSFPSPAV